MIRQTIVFLTLVLGVGFATPLVAQTDAEMAQAKKLFDRGATFYNGGKYAEAITEFQRAFAVVPNALFLYNISLAQSKLGLLKEARTTGINATHYEGMGDKTKLRNVARIAALGPAVASQKLAKRLVKVDPVVTTEPEPIGEPDPVRKTETRSSFGALGYSGIALAVIGAGGLVATWFIATNVDGQIDEYESAAAAGDESEYNDLRNDIEKKQTLGLVTLGIGSVFVATGITLIIVDLVNDGERATAYLSPTTDGAEIGVSFQF